MAAAVACPPRVRPLIPDRPAAPCRAAELGKRQEVLPLDIARDKAMRRLASLVKLLGQYQELAEARELLGAVQRLLDGGKQAA